MGVGCGVGGILARAAVLNQKHLQVKSAYNVLYKLINKHTNKTTWGGAGFDTQPRQIKEQVTNLTRANLSKLWA